MAYRIGCELAITLSGLGSKVQEGRHPEPEWPHTRTTRDAAPSTASRGGWDARLYPRPCRRHRSRSRRQLEVLRRRDS